MPPSSRRSQLRIRRFSTIELLVTLLLWMIVSPFIDVVPFGQFLDSILITAVLLSAVVVVGAGRRTRLIAILLAVPSVLGRWIDHFYPSFPDPIYLVGSLLFVSFVVVQMLRFTLKAPRVDVAVLCAAIANFLMLGLIWIFAYQLVALLDPNSFNFASNPGAKAMDGATAFYFSFVTLSTVGYGDIVPVSSVARMLAILEAIVGMFYMTVLVARLVAMYSTETGESGKK